MLNKIAPPTQPAIGLSRYSGRIGFLKRAGEVRFRNIEIKELSSGEGKSAPAADEAKKEDPKPQEGRKVGRAAAVDSLPVGSAWKGTRTYRKGWYAGTTVHYEIHVDKREEAKFTGRKFDNGAGRNRAEIEGTIEKATITWREQNAIFPDIETQVKATLDKEVLRVQFKIYRASVCVCEGDAELKRE